MRYFHNSLDNILNNNDFLNNLLNRLGYIFENDCFFLKWLRPSNFNNNFLNYFHGFDLFNLNNFFYYFLNVHWNLNYFLDYFLDCYNLVSIDYNLFWLRNNIIYWSINGYDLSINYNFFYNLLNFNNFGYLDYFLNNSFNYFWDFYNFLDYTWYFNNFLNHIINNSYDFNWDMNNFLYFLNSRNLDNFLNNFLDWNYLWNLHKSLSNFLNNLLYLHYLRHNSKNFKYIIYINNSHNLLVDHTNNTLIHFKNSASSSF